MKEQKSLEPLECFESKTLRLIHENTETKLAAIFLVYDTLDIVREEIANDPMQCTKKSFKTFEKKYLKISKVEMDLEKKYKKLHKKSTYYAKNKGIIRIMEKYVDFLMKERDFYESCIDLMSTKMFKNNFLDIRLRNLVVCKMQNLITDMNVCNLAFKMYLEELNELLDEQTDSFYYENMREQFKNIVRDIDMNCSEASCINIDVEVRVSDLIE